MGCCQRCVHASELSLRFRGYSARGLFRPHWEPIFDDGLILAIMQDMKITSPMKFLTPVLEQSVSYARAKYTPKTLKTPSPKP